MSKPLPSDHSSASGQDTYYDTTEEDPGKAGQSGRYSPETAARIDEELKEDLRRTEEDIATLRQVLSDKVKHAQELKRKLGITVWKEFRDDMNQGIRTIQESTAYQKTSQSIKNAGEKTSQALDSISSTVHKKLEEVKKSPAYRSFEDKVSNVYTDAKNKVAGQNNKPNSDFEEALDNMQRRQSSSSADTKNSGSSGKKSP